MKLEPFRIRIETRPGPGGQWGFLFLFDGNPNEPPLLSGPWKDDAQARRKAEELAERMVRARRVRGDLC